VALGTLMSHILKQDWGLSPVKRPPTRGRALDILDVVPGDGFRVTILSPEFQGWNCHWISPRTRACVEGSRPCPWCMKEQPRKAYWFLHVEEREAGGQWVLQLTDYGADPLFRRGAERGSLRGLYCSVRRRTRNKRSPIIVTVNDAVEPDRVRLPWQDCQPTVQRLWEFPKDVDPTTVVG